MNPIVFIGSLAHLPALNSLRDALTPTCASFCSDGPPAISAASASTILDRCLCTPQPRGDQSIRACDLRV
jgi:hypothetical protein